MTPAPGRGVLFVCASPSRPARLQKTKEIERMIQQIRRLFQKRHRNVFRVVLTGGLTAGTLLIAATATLDGFQEIHSHDDPSTSPGSSKLIEIVRNATRQFQDVN